MIVDQAKLHNLLSHPLLPPAPGELRREADIFFVGGALPPQETLETLFDSYSQSPVDLFHLTFGSDFFQRGEELARLIKKNFNNHLVGQLDDPTPPLLERAYAAGVDILHLQLQKPASDPGHMFKSVGAAQAVFTRWKIAASVMAGDDSLDTTAKTIDTLLSAGIVPLVTVAAGATDPEVITAVFQYLLKGWESFRVPLQPLLPLIYGTTPLVAAKPKGFLRGFINKMEDRRLLATSDLRRSLRVQQVEESFGSAAL